MKEQTSQIQEQSNKQQQQAYAIVMVIAIPDNQNLSIFPIIDQVILNNL